MDAKFQPCQDDEAPNNLLIMTHGFRGSMEGGGRAAYLSQMASLFVNVLRFNFTGSQILSQQIEELNAVLDFAMKEYKNPRIFYWGAAGRSGFVGYCFAPQRNCGPCFMGNAERFTRYF